MLSLSHTLYQLFHILFPSLPLSLSPELSLTATVVLQCFGGPLSRARSVAVYCAAGTLPGRLQARGAHHAHATGSVPAALALPGADSLRRQWVYEGSCIYEKTREPLCIAFVI